MTRVEAVFPVISENEHLIVRDDERPFRARVVVSRRLAAMGLAFRFFRVAIGSRFVIRRVSFRVAAMAVSH